MLAHYYSKEMYILTGMETRQFLSCMFVIAKIKELFASTLKILAASVRCVSSMIVLLNAKLPD